MFLFRVTNEFDSIINPKKNGFISKKLLYDATYRHLLYTQKEKIEQLSSKEKDEYIKEYMHIYLAEHIYKIDKIFRKNYKETRDTIHHFVEEKDNFSYCKMIKDLSSLPNHLINGSKIYTNWISATSDFDGIWKYYDRQKIHEVAVIEVNTNGVFDENTYVVNLSNREIIDNIKFLSNKIDDNDYNTFIDEMKEHPEYQSTIVNTFNKFVMKPTDKKFSGFNFASSSSEYCIYNHIPKEYIRGFLDSLQIDLICADLFNEDILMLHQTQQSQELKKLKNMMLRHILEENNPYMLFVFEELYLKKHNISEITNSLEEQENMENMRNLILTKSRTLPSKLIRNCNR